MTGIRLHHLTEILFNQKTLLKSLIGVYRSHLVQSKNRREIYIPNDDTSLHYTNFYTIQEYETGRSLLIGMLEL
jgi:hypothetical protein